MRKAICILLCTAVLMATCGCGTLLYPERKGQKSGKVDVMVALIDGLLVLPGVIPGVLAIIIDCDNGCIYETEEGLFSQYQGPQLTLYFLDKDGIPIEKMATEKHGQIKLTEHLKSNIANIATVDIYSGKQKLGSTTLQALRR